MGIDPGLAATGVGVVTGAGLKVSQYAYGAIKTSQKKPPACRLSRIFDNVKCLLDEEKPHLMVLEDVFSLDKYPHSGIMLGKVCGVILLAAQQLNIPVREIAVREAKKVLTGNGAASKQQLEKAVRNATGCASPIRPYHASDALGLALIGLFRYAQHRRVQ